MDECQLDSRVEYKHGRGLSYLADSGHHNNGYFQTCFNWQSVLCCVLAFACPIIMRTTKSDIIVPLWPFTQQTVTPSTQFNCSFGHSSVTITRKGIESGYSYCQLIQYFCSCFVQELNLTVVVLWQIVVPCTCDQFNLEWELRTLWNNITWQPPTSFTFSILSL